MVYAVVAACGGGLPDLGDAGGGSDATTDTTVQTDTGSDAPNDVGPADVGPDVPLGQLTLATGQYAQAIAVDGTHAYWVNGSGNVVRCNKLGCNGTPISLASGQSSSFGIVVDAYNVYWTNYSSGTVMQCAKTGCAGNPITLASFQTNPSGIAVDANAVYWVNATSGGGVMMCAIGGCGGSPTMLANGQMVPSAIAVDGTYLYWTNYQGGTVVKCPLAGCLGSPLGLAFSQPNPYGIAIDKTTVYWTTDTAGPNMVMSCGIDGCDAGPKLIAMDPNPWQVAVDALNVYWTQYGIPDAGGAVLKCAITGCGGNPTPLVSLSSGNLAGLAIDVTSVYWTNISDGSVMKLTPK